MAKTDPNAPQQQTLAVAKPQQNFLVFDSIEHFEHALRMCKCLASANMLPKHFQGEQNIGNCMIALEIAHRGPYCRARSHVMVRNIYHWTDQHVRIIQHA